MQSLRSTSSSGTVTIPKEEYNILRNKASDQKSRIEQLEYKLKITEDELQSTNIDLTKERKIASRLIQWEENDRILLQAISKVKSTGKIDPGIEQKFVEGEPLDQMLTLVGKQNTELKHLRRKLQTQVLQIETLVGMVLEAHKLGTLDTQSYKLKEYHKSVEPRPDYSVLSTPVQCTDSHDLNPAEMLKQIMLLKGSTEVNIKDAGDIFIRESNFLPDHLKHVSHRNEESAYHSSNEQSSARFDFQNVQQSSGRNESTLMKVKLESTERMAEEHTQRHCPLCNKLFSIHTREQEEEFKIHVDDHLN